MTAPRILVLGNTTIDHVLSVPGQIDVDTKVNEKIADPNIVAPPQMAFDICESDRARKIVEKLLVATRYVFRRRHRRAISHAPMVPSIPATWSSHACSVMKPARCACAVRPS